MIDICARPIVVGFDDHDASRRAVVQAARLARALDVYLHVLHVVVLQDTPIDPDTADWEDEVNERLAALQEHAEALIALPGDSWSYHVQRGDPWRTLLRLASDIDAGLIVIGQHLHARVLAAAVGHLLAGHDVAEHLVRHGNRPILVVPSADGQTYD